MWAHVFPYLKFLYLKTYWGFPGGSDSKEPAYNAGDPGSIPREDPLEKGMAIHSSILAWRIPWSLAGCSPLGHKESDTTE